MSVQNQTAKTVYTGNGSTTVFPFTFALLETDGEYVRVYVTNDAGISEKTTNFEIDTSAKTVTYPKTGDPLPVGKKIVIRREIPNEQELNLENLGPFFADDVEGEFDREVMMIQQLQEAVDRSIKVDPASDTKPEELIVELLEASADAVAAAEAAKTSENNAAASETAAGNSATSAANSASAAGTSETNAAASETNASNSASAAAGSATAAYNSQVAAAASETAAGNSATAAGTSATNAGNSATAAGNSATAAHNSQVAAKASEDAAAQSAAEAAGINYLVRKNSTTYAEGVVAFYQTIPSPLVLECTTTGITAATEPDFSGAVEGGTVTDGGVVWTYKSLLGVNGANKDLSNLTQTGEDHFLDQNFIIIYPNGGTESIPANVSLNTQYIENNPFPGYYVKCVPELLYNGNWILSAFINNKAGNGEGVSAEQRAADGSIIVTVGNVSVIGGSGGLNVYPMSDVVSNYPNSNQTSPFPCRVKVWKIGKI